MIAILLIAVIVPLKIDSDRVDATTVRQVTVQAVAQQWASAAGWSVVAVAADHATILVDAIGPSPRPDPAALRHELIGAGLGGTDVRVSLQLRVYIPVTH